MSEPLKTAPGSSYGGFSWRQVYLQFGAASAKASDKFTVRNFRTKVLRELKKIKLRFVYFGRDALRIPRHLRPDVPAGRSAHGTQTCDLARATRFIDYVFGVADAAVMARPHQWPRADTSWKTHDAPPGPDRAGPAHQTAYHCAVRWGTAKTSDRTREKQLLGDAIVGSDYGR